MSRKQPPGTVQRYVQRQGEGHTVDLMVVADTDSSIVSRLDLGTLPVPDRRFTADVANVAVEPTMVKLLFGQKQPIGGGLLALVVISMAFESVHQFLQMADENFEKNFAGFGAQLPKGHLTEFTEKAEQTVILNSSVVLAGYTGSIGCFDFYFASPFSMQQVALFKKIALEPIVRINLPSPLLFAILGDLRRRAPDLPLFKSSQS